MCDEPILKIQSNNSSLFDSLFLCEHPTEHFEMSLNWKTRCININLIWTNNAYFSHFILVIYTESIVRSMLFYSLNCRQQNWAQFLLYINRDCIYISDNWLQLWPKNRGCKNTVYYSIFQLLLLLFFNNY